MTTTAAAATTTTTAPHEWILWEHKMGKRVKTDLQWKEATAEVCHFFHQDQPFSCDLHHLPMPSDAFFKKDESSHHSSGHGNPHNHSGHAAAAASGHKDKPHVAPPTHTEFSLFKKGIFPDWEDESCADGGFWYVRQYFPAAHLDHYWQSLVRGVVDEKIDVTHVVGVRIDDKSKFKHPLYKIEIWIDTRDQKIRDRIRDAVTKLMTDGQPAGKVNALKLHWRSFEHAVKHGSDEENSERAPSEQAASEQGASEHGKKEVEATSA